MTLVINYSFLKSKQCITAEIYYKQLDERYIQLCKLRSALINRRDPILLQVNSLPHIAMTILQKLTNMTDEILLHLPYSTDIFPIAQHFSKLIVYPLSQKTLLCKYDAEITFKAFLEFKSLQIYHKGIINILIRWQ